MMPCSAGSDTNTARVAAAGLAVSREAVVEKAMFRRSGLALVLCTGAAQRRPSVWLLMRRREGCCSPAVGWTHFWEAACWSNFASGVPPLPRKWVHPAGP